MRQKEWKKRGAILLLASLGALFLSGCSVLVPPISTPAPVEMALNTPQILPKADASDTEKKEMSLYFRMQGESMLVRETRTVMLPVDTQLEQVLIQALIDGPSPHLLNMNGLFIPGTKVISVSQSGSLLTVTLSPEFLDTPADAPANWNTNFSWRSEVLLRRRLALSSIVNTITEATDFTAVQLLVQQNNEDTVGRRIPRMEIYEATEGDALLTPVSRDEHSILTHFNTAVAILNCWRGKDYSRLSRYICESPTEAAFQQEIVNHNRSLTNYSLTPGIISSDGTSAVLSAMLEYTDVNGVVLVENYPIHLICDEGLWKMRYATLLKLMEASGL